MTTNPDDSPSYLQGMIFLHRQDFEGARRCFEQALRDERPAGAPLRLIPILGNLGNVCAALGENEQARSYYREILELQRHESDFKTAGQTLVNLGNLSRELGELERARAYYLESEQHLERVGDAYSQGILYSNFGLLEHDRGNHEEAVRFFTKAIELHKQTGHEEGLAATWGQLGRTYRRLADDHRAETCFNFSYTHYAGLGNPAGQIEALRHLSQIYEDRNDPELALHCMTRLQEIQMRLGLPGPTEDEARTARLSQLLKSKKIS
jgi:tetratricopeptide (TPR) repeat protein